MKIAPITRFEIIGHRGNPGNPLNSINIENTLPSFQSAWQLGADGIELAVILCKSSISKGKLKDSGLVVHHDDRFGRVFSMIASEEQKLVSEYDYGDLQLGTELNIEGLTKQLIKDGSTLTNNITNVWLPSLYEISVPNRKKLFLELKFIDDKSPQDQKYLKDLVKKAVEYIIQNNLIDQTYVLSFVGEALDEVKKLNAKIVTAHNIYQGEASDLQKIKQLQKDYGFDIMNPPFNQATKEAIENIHNVGLKTYPWVWKESPKQELREIVRLMNDGAHGAITNQVEAALNATFQYHK